MADETYPEGFINLPQANQTPAEKALQDAARNGVTTGPSPETIAAIDRYKASLADSARLQSVGVFVSDAATKALEGAKAVASRFGTALNNQFPFLKLGSASPTLASLASPAALAAGGADFGDAVSRRLQQQTTALASAAAVNNAMKQQNAEEDRSHIVTLTDSEGYILEFLVMPEIVENRTVDYEAVAPAQFPGAFQKYKGTPSVQWSVNATLISRTTSEATLNLLHLNRLRGWTMPFFGENTHADFKTKLGAPPPVLKFKGLRKGIIGEVPVVITSLNWNWPRDVDYIPAFSLTDAATTPNIPFPTVLQVAIQLVESFSTEQFNQFSLTDYRLGNVVEAYNKTVPIPQQTQIPPKTEAQTVQQGSGLTAANLGTSLANDSRIARAQGQAILDAAKKKTISEATTAAANAGTRVVRDNVAGTTTRIAGPQVANGGSLGPGIDGGD